MLTICLQLLLTSGLAGEHQWEVGALEEFLPPGASESDAHAPPDSVDVTATSPRPVADALFVVSRSFPWRYSYEEVWPPLAGDRVQIEKPDGSGSYSVMRSTAIDTTCARLEGPRACLEAILASHHRGGGVGRFAVIETGDTLSVVPADTIAASGAVEPATPLLGTEVTVAPGEETLDALVVAIAAAVTDVTGVQVSITMAPTETLTCGVEGTKSARALLADAVRCTQAPVTWHLYASPLGGYGLNIVRAWDETAPEE